MKVKDAQALLSTMPPDADMHYAWHGEARSAVCHIWLARNGNVIIADQDEAMDVVEERPVDAPREEGSHWATPWLNDEGKGKSP